MHDLNQSTPWDRTRVAETTPVSVCPDSSSTSTVGGDVDGFVDRLVRRYERVFGGAEPAFADVLRIVAGAALGWIATSDAAYHDVRHTMLVTDAGGVILQGLQAKNGSVSPRDWLNAHVAMLCHDVGYVRGAIIGDRSRRFVIDAEGYTVYLPEGATDAALQPYHVDRSKLFAVQQFASIPEIDLGVVLACIEYTRFPVPDIASCRETDTLRALVRAADLIGQLADGHYLTKLESLYSEFEEIGLHQQMGFASPADMRAHYPHFYWTTVGPLVKDAVEFMRLTRTGKRWVANLYAQVFAQEKGVTEL